MNDQTPDRAPESETPPRPEGEGASERQADHASSAPPSAAASSAGGSSPNDAAAEPIELHPEETDAAAPTTSRACPSCGETVLTSAPACPRCGFDLRPRSTSTEPASGAPAAAPAAAVTTAPTWLNAFAATIAVVCLLGMIVAYLAGVTGLFPRVEGLFRGPDGVFDATAPMWSARFMECLRYVVQRAILFAAALLALIATGLVSGHPIPSLRDAMPRLAALVCAVGLVLLVPLEPRGLEAGVELGAEAGLYFLGCMVLFRMRPERAAVLLGVTVLMIAVVAFAARLLVWAI